MRKKDQPHDRYFKDCMHHLAVARKFLEVYLDKDISEVIDFSTLSPYDTSLIGEKGKQLYADVVYRAMSMQGSEVFFIFNHERKPDELLLVRMVEYSSGTLRRIVKQKRGKPGFIVSFTLYNGLKHPYPYPKDIVGYYEEIELAKKILLKGHRIIDLSAYSDEELCSHGALSTMELFMKHVDNPDFPQWLESNPEIAIDLEKSAYIERSLRYVAEAGYSAMEELLNSLEGVSAKLRSDMLTTAKQIEKKAWSQGKQEGIQQGVHQGMHQGMQTERMQIARNMLLNLHLDMNVTQRATGLSKEELERIQLELAKREIPGSAI